MQYKILVNSDRRTLEDVIESYLKEGWELQGGVSMAVMNNNNDGYAQAVIKKDS